MRVLPANRAPTSILTTPQSYAFQAANALTGTLSSDFKLFFSFDYLGGAGPWPKDTVISILQDYGSNGAYFHVDGKPFVSTFEGPTNSDITEWSTIRTAVEGGIYFVPDWTSLGPNGVDLNLIDGACRSFFLRELSKTD